MKWRTEGRKEEVEKAEVKEELEKWQQMDGKGRRDE